MFKILTYNQISAFGLEKLPADRFQVAADIAAPDAILLRSYDLHGVDIPDTVKAVGRAGTGVNNIPVADYSNRGIPVFNAPGANANAVAELVIAGMLISARNIEPALDFVRTLEGDDDSLDTQVEKGKKQFAGFELTGKTIGVVGLGAIGVKVCNAATALGLNVIGFDPQMTVESAWQLSSSAVKAGSLDELIARADFISLHVPLNDHTRHLINATRVDRMKNNVTLLNFARAPVVDEAVVVSALNSGKMHAYVTDFPSNALLNHAKAILLPHLGASTSEAEDNCAIMVAEQIQDFLENGNIRRSVNFPDVVLPRTEGVRLAIANENVPNMVSQITTALAENSLNIIDMLNKSRGNYAYTLIDIETAVDATTLEHIKAIHGVLSVRVI
jgi:D-3-phosphoglycerate dehydrogenase / 2-oxoglutarate reductase